MMLKRTLLAISLFSLPVLAQPVFAQTSPEGPQRIRILVRNDGKGTFTPDSLKLKVEGKSVAPVAVNPVMDSRTPVELVIALDDGLGASFANSLDTLRKFVLGLPPNVRVGVGYMQNGRVLIENTEEFTTDKSQAVRALRIPRQQLGISGSPYFCIQDISTHWPSNQRAARMLLVVTSGVDPYNGRPTPMNQNSPYVDEASRAAQRNGVAVYSIFWGDWATRPMGYASFSGSSYLQQIADDTGGDLLSPGTLNPPDISGFLKRFSKDMENTYLVAFDAPNKRDLDLKVSSSASGVKLKAPRLVGNKR